MRPSSPESTSTPIAIVTGGNRGLGFETSRLLAQRGFHVLLAARDAARGEEAARNLRDEQLPVEFLAMDVADPASLELAAAEVARRWGRLDLLVNSAAINLDAGRPIFEIPSEDFLQMLAVNLFGPMEVCRAFWPLLENSSTPRVINVSSGSARLADMNDGQFPHVHRSAYAITKTSLNALTRQLSALGQGKIAVNSVNPGWLRTDMGGGDALRTAAEGAQLVVRVATMPTSVTGRFIGPDGHEPW